ncbi:MAG: ferrous iron transport protein B [Eubacteriales bacterium]
MRVALTGNPNSGKTTLFNALTGKKEHAGNWAGVTVGVKESPVKSDFSPEKDITAVDLPGAYSMSPFTSEESITSTYVRKSNPDVIINIVDATNMSRSLFFTTQLLELGIPVVVALNKWDSTQKKEIEIDVDALAEKLHCPVVKTTATAGEGLEILITQVNAVFGKEQEAPYHQGSVNLGDKEEVVVADKERFDFVDRVVSVTEKRQVASHETNKQDKLDGILAHKILGIPIFAAVMWLVFSISQAWVGPVLGETLAGVLEGFGEVVGEAMGDASPFMVSLLVDGIIGGVAAVLGFLPLVMVMYFLIALLEDCGYMARVAVVMDPIMKKVGLTGKSVIPMVIGTGCAIPAVMASRTIRNERERRTTAMLTPFMPCGAKIPVIALFAGVFFDDAAWVSTLMYFSGIALIIIGAFLIQIITGHKNRKSFFIIELPEYAAPSIGRACLSMLDRAKDFIIKAGTIILLCNAAVHVMQNFDTSLQYIDIDAAIEEAVEVAMEESPDEVEAMYLAFMEDGLSEEEAEEEVAAEFFAIVMEDEAFVEEVRGMSASSILAKIATPFALIFIPLGFGTWQLAAAAVTGFIAKENVVGTLAVVYGISNFIDTEELELVQGAGEVAGVMGLGSAAALAYLMFNLFTPPCFAAIGAMNSEMRSAKWLWAGIGLQFGTGYTVAFFVYQIGSLMTVGSLGEGFLLGLILVAAMLGYLGYLMATGKNGISKEYILNGSDAKANSTV